MEQNQKETELSEEEKNKVGDAPQTEETEKTGPDDGAKSGRPAEPEDDGAQISEEQKKKIVCALAYVFGILFFLPLVWMPFRQTGMVERFPTLIVCCFTVLAALLSFFNGMVLDSIRQKEKREFEFRLSLLSILQNRLFRHEGRCGEEEVCENRQNQQ